MIDAEAIKKADTVAETILRCAQATCSELKFACGEHPKVKLLYKIATALLQDSSINVMHHAVEEYKDEMVDMALVESGRKG